MNRQILIVIPARYASTRLPGKPLHKIAGVEMIVRVARIAQSVCKKYSNCDYVVATDDVRISDFCQSKEINAVITSDACTSGTERCLEAVMIYNPQAEFVVNLQGDNPLCPTWFIESLIDEWMKNSDAGVYTPAVVLSWHELDALRENKKTTPYSGTTVEVDKFGYAITFSKNIIPAIRKEANYRESDSKSFVRRHIGLYAYTKDALKKYFELEAGVYEKTEGLEQMRFIENRIPVKIVDVDYRGLEGMSGIDSPEDVERAEKIIAKQGEINL